MTDARLLLVGDVGGAAGLDVLAKAAALVTSDRVTRLVVDARAALPCEDLLRELEQLALAHGATVDVLRPSP